jgi:ABC-type branched-subunit amino acid transport system permease subunit
MTPVRETQNTWRRERTLPILSAALVVLLAVGPFLPQWALSFVSVALYLGIVVLGMALLMRTGLVSFGQGLYYCLGAYAAGTLDHFYQISDLLLMAIAGALLPALVALVLGLLLAKYRDIFFAMLSLAFSMILYGLLVKTSALGSTDGFGLSVKTFAGVALGRHWVRYAICAFAAVLAAACAAAVHRYSSSHLGRLAGAIRDNELRVEYMGASVRRVIHLNYVIAAALAGIGGALMAATIGHVDPETTANWTTSGEFVFIAILSGTGSVLAPFLGAGIFEAVRTFALERFPNTWQMTLGVTMLLVIMFLPGGLWSVFRLQRRGV